MEKNPQTQPNAELYTQYENLAPYEERTNFFDLMRTVSTMIVENKDNDWKVNFDLINALRRMWKHQRDLFFTIFTNYKLHMKILPQFINSLRSNIAKVTLTLVSEMLSVNENEYKDNEYEDLSNKMPKWISYLLPEVLNKSAMDLKSFIKEEALKCLTNLSENMFYDETILELLKGVKNSNLKVSENACFYLVKLINNYEKNNLENSLSWKNILSSLREIYQMKRNNYVKKYDKITSALENKIGKEKFEVIVKSNLKGNFNLSSNASNCNSKMKANSNSVTFKQKIKEYRENKENNFLKINII